MEGKILSYRDLEVWKNGVKPAKDIYQLTESWRRYLSIPSVTASDKKTQINTYAINKRKRNRISKFTILCLILSVYQK